jgi:hypothetical protein
MKNHPLPDFLKRMETPVKRDFLLSNLVNLFLYSHVLKTLVIYICLQVIYVMALSQVWPSTGSRFVDWNWILRVLPAWLVEIGIYWGRSAALVAALMVPFISAIVFARISVRETFLKVVISLLILIVLFLGVDAAIYIVLTGHPLSDLRVHFTIVSFICVLGFVVGRLVNKLF